MNLSIAIPSNVSFAEKNSLVVRANESKIGVFMSDLPPNHDLFQLLSIWREKYSYIPIVGTAIISPLLYEKNFLLKQIRTAFEINQSGLEIGLGIGDKNLLPTTISNRLEIFEQSINQLITEKSLKMNNNVISIAGSGKRLMDLANNTSSGLIYNGIIGKDILKLIVNEKTRKNVSSYIMADLNDYESLSNIFVSIVSRILTGFPKKDLLKLEIEENKIEQIRIQTNKRNFSQYKEWLSEDVIRKVAIIGTSEQVFEELNTMNKLNIKQIILSIVGSSKRNEFISYLFENSKNL